MTVQIQQNIGTQLTDLDAYAHELERSCTYIIEKIDELKSGKTEVYSLEEVA